MSSSSHRLGLEEKEHKRLESKEVSTLSLEHIKIALNNYGKCGVFPNKEALIVALKPHSLSDLKDLLHVVTEFVCDGTPFSYVEPLVKALLEYVDSTDAIKVLLKQEDARKETACLFRMLINKLPKVTQENFTTHDEILQLIINRNGAEYFQLYFDKISLAHSYKIQMDSQFEIGSKNLFHRLADFGEMPFVRRDPDARIKMLNYLKDKNIYQSQKNYDPLNSLDKQGRTPLDYASQWAARKEVDALTALGMTACDDLTCLFRFQAGKLIKTLIQVPQSELQQFPSRKLIKLDENNFADITTDNFRHLLAYPKDNQELAVTRLHSTSAPVTNAVLRIAALGNSNEAFLPVIGLNMDDKNHLLMGYPLTSGSLSTFFHPQTTPLDLQTAFGLATQLFAPLTAAHEAHIIHGHIFPEQILFMKDGKAVLSGIDLSPSLHDEPSHIRLQLWGPWIARHSAFPPELIASETSNHVNNFTRLSDVYMMGRVLNWCAIKMAKLAKKSQQYDQYERLIKFLEVVADFATQSELKNRINANTLDLLLKSIQIAFWLSLNIDKKFEKTLLDTYEYLMDQLAMREIPIQIDEDDTIKKEILFNLKNELETARKNQNKGSKKIKLDKLIIELSALLKNPSQLTMQVQHEHKDEKEVKSSVCSLSPTTLTETLIKSLILVLNKQRPKALSDYEKSKALFANYKKRIPSLRHLPFMRLAGPPKGDYASNVIFNPTLLNLLKKDAKLDTTKASPVFYVIEGDSASGKTTLIQNTLEQLEGRVAWFTESVHSESKILNTIEQDPALRPHYIVIRCANKKALDIYAAKCHQKAKVNGVKLIYICTDFFKSAQAFKYKDGYWINMADINKDLNAGNFANSIFNKAFADQKNIQTLASLLGHTKSILNWAFAYTYHCKQTADSFLAFLQLQMKADHSQNYLTTCINFIIRQVPLLDKSCVAQDMLASCAAVCGIAGSKVRLDHVVTYMKLLRKVDDTEILNGLKLLRSLDLIRVSPEGSYNNLNEFLREKPICSMNFNIALHTISESIKRRDMGRIAKTWINVFKALHLTDSKENEFKVGIEKLKSDPILQSTLLGFLDLSIASTHKKECENIILALEYIKDNEILAQQVAYYKNSLMSDSPGTSIATILSDTPQSLPNRLKFSDYTSTIWDTVSQFNNHFAPDSSIPIAASDIKPIAIEDNLEKYLRNLRTHYAPLPVRDALWKIFENMIRRFLQGYFCISKTNQEREEEAKRRQAEFDAEFKQSKPHIAFHLTTHAHTHLIRILAKLCNFMTAYFRNHPEFEKAVLIMLDIADAFGASGNKLFDAFTKHEYGEREFIFCFRRTNGESHTNNYRHHPPGSDEHKGLYSFTVKGVLLTREEMEMAMDDELVRQSAKMSPVGAEQKLSSESKDVKDVKSEVKSEAVAAPTTKKSKKARQKERARAQTLFSNSVSVTNNATVTKPARIR